MMIKIIILAVCLGAVFCSNPTCASQCLTCEEHNNPFSCLSCFPNNQYIYIFSCQSAGKDFIPFAIIAVIITILHLFALAMGFGIYRDMFQNIQLAALITWRYDFDRGAIGLQGTNLAIVRNNSFPDTFGAQFIVVMILLGLYWLVLILVYRSKNSPTAILMKRKKIIFPVRIITFIFNITLYAGLIQVKTVKTESTIKVFAFILAIFALVKIAVVLIGLVVTCNWKRFQVQDPHYYVLIEQITVKRWYAKNNVLISLLTRGTIIILFVFFFQRPTTGGVLMLIVQALYTVYIIILLRYQNIRYFICIVAGNILMIGIVLTIYLSNLYTIGSPQWKSLSLGYQVLLSILVFLFFIVTMLELIIKKDIIIKQIKSFYRRFIKCQKQDQEVFISKYDEHSNRQKVTEFHENSLYKKQIFENNIELTNNQDSRSD